MKSKQKFKLSSLSLAMFSSSIFFVTPSAIAADEVSDVEKVERISVTGSRIARTELVGPAPVTVLDRAQIDASGAIDIATLLQEIPAANGASLSTNLAFSNGSDKVALSTRR